MRTRPNPTVALVHGAFADSAGWNDVIAQLLAEGVPAVAVSNPLRGIAHDAAYVAVRSDKSQGPSSPSATPTAVR